MEYNQPCGCVVRVSDELSSTVEIKYCPVHAARTELSLPAEELVALTEATDKMVKKCD